MKQYGTHGSSNALRVGAAPERLGKLKLHASVGLPAVADIVGIRCLEVMAIVLDIDTSLSKFGSHFVFQAMVEAAEKNAFVAADTAVNGNHE